MEVFRPDPPEPLRYWQLFCDIRIEDVKTRRLRPFSPLNSHKSATSGGLKVGAEENFNNFDASYLASGAFAGRGQRGNLALFFDALSICISRFCISDFSTFDLPEQVLDPRGSGELRTDSGTIRYALQYCSHIGCTKMHGKLTMVDQRCNFRHFCPFRHFFYSNP